MASFQYGGLVEQVANTATAGGTTTLTNTSRQIQVFTGSLNQTVVLPSATTMSVGQKFEIYNSSTGVITILANGGLPPVDNNGAGSIPNILSPNSSLVIKLSANGSAAGVWVPIASNNNASSGTKNYLSPYIASSGSSVPNPGNGNFELTTTQGWSLAHSVLTSLFPTSVASAGTAFSSSNGGTAATALALNALGTFSLATTGTLTASSNAISLVASVVGIKVGMLASCATTGFPSPAFVIGISGSNVFLNAPFTGSTTPGASITFFTGSSATSAFPIGGSYSAALATNSVASMPVSTPGDMLISDAFNVDTEDQSKILQVKFSYANLSGTSLNFSGTSANSLSIWIYDVTNAVWIQPAGVYNLVQGTGVGIATATFQSSSNGIKYQLAILNVNASAAPYAILIDDLSVGPQISVSAPAVGDWQQYTVNITATITNPTKGATIFIDRGMWRRVGDSMEIRYDYSQTSAGTSGSGVYLFNIPPGYTIDSSKIFVGTSGGLGKVGDVNMASSVSGNFTGDVMIHDATTFSLKGVDPSAASGQLFDVTNGSCPLSASTANYSWFARVPITGWSSNSVMSQDTDTRLVSARVFRLSAGQAFTASTFQQLQFGGVTEDTHAAYNSTTTYRYTVPVSGDYEISPNISWAPAGANGQVNLALYKNGSNIQSQIGYLSVSNNTGVSATFKDTAKAGDYYELYANPSTTVSLLSDASITGGSAWCIKRLSGPAVIAATETVACKAWLNGSQNMNSGTPTQINLDTIEFDTHKAFSGFAYTIPVAGFYEIKGNIGYAANNTNQREVHIFKNSSRISIASYAPTPGGGNGIYHAATLVQCKSGDIIYLSGQQNSGVTLGVANAQDQTFMTIHRVK